MKKRPLKPLAVIVTCGPAATPIDEVRRITNHSTGRLGITLANALTAAGHRVICFKGIGATWPVRLRTHEAHAFFTNRDLAAALESFGGADRVDVVFHAAALCDFEVAGVVGKRGTKLKSRKVSSRAGRIQIALRPAAKVLPRLGKWFPNARIVGWKYELDGDRETAIDRAREQISECRTAACVVNGAAYGNGFGICAPGGPVDHCQDLKTLVNRLVKWAGAETPL